VRHSPGARRITLGADKGYDAAAFVADMRALNVIGGRRPVCSEDNAPIVSATAGVSTRYQEGEGRRSRCAGWSQLGQAKPWSQGDEAWRASRRDQRGPPGRWAGNRRLRCRRR
jgi:hypothetical protein